MPEGCSPAQGDEGNIRDYEEWINKKRPFTFGKSEKRRSPPALSQLAIKLQFFWRKLSRLIKLVVNSKGSEILTLKKF